MTTAPYAWTCLACEGANPPAAGRCVRCGCPHDATALQIESTRRNWRQRTGLPPQVDVDPVALLRALPLLSIAAVGLLLAGALFLIVDAGASSTAFGGLLIALAALAATSSRPAAGG